MVCVVGPFLLSICLMWALERCLHFIMSLCSLKGPPGGGGPPGTPIMPSPAGKGACMRVCVCACVIVCIMFDVQGSKEVFLFFFFVDSTNSGDNMYTMINSVPPGGGRPNVRPRCVCVCVCVCVWVCVCVRLCVWGTCARTRGHVVNEL